MWTPEYYVYHKYGVSSYGKQRRTRNRTPAFLGFSWGRLRGKCQIGLKSVGEAWSCRLAYFFFLDMANRLICPLAELWVERNSCPMPHSTQLSLRAIDLAGRGLVPPTSARAAVLESSLPCGPRVRDEKRGMVRGRCHARRIHEGCPINSSVRKEGVVQDYADATWFTIYGRTSPSSKMQDHEPKSSGERRNDPRSKGKLNLREPLRGSKHSPVIRLS